MKPRSTVSALLAITETLLAARAKAKAAQTKQASARREPRSAKAARFLTESRPLFLRITTQAIS